MKIWPFDELADETGGTQIRALDMERGLEPFKRIRARHGDRMEVALELHGRWNLPAAMSIARAVEPYRPIWIEDPIRMDNIDVLREFVRSTPIPVVASENLGSPFPYRDLLERSRRRDHHGGPILGRGRDRRAQDCRPRGDLPAPVHAARLHRPGHARRWDAPLSPRENAMFQEMVRAYYFGWYAELVDGLPIFDAGRLRPADGPATVPSCARSSGRRGREDPGVAFRSLRLTRVAGRGEDRRYLRAALAPETRARPWTLA